MRGAARAEVLRELESGRKRSADGARKRDGALPEALTPEEELQSRPMA